MSTFANDSFELVLNIPNENQEKFQEHIKKLQKIADKLDLPKIALKKLYTITLFKKVRNTKEEYSSKVSYFIKEVNSTVWEIKGKSPVLEGWILLGVLDFDKGKPYPMVRTAPSQEVPAKYFTTTCRCDHCESNRFRKVVYVLKNVKDDEEVVQVGSSCLKDFIGQGPIEEMLKFYTYLTSASDNFSFLEEDDRGVLRIHFSEILLEKNFVLRSLVKFVDALGYVSRKMADEAFTLHGNERDTTASQLSWCYLTGSGFNLIRKDEMSSLQQKMMELMWHTPMTEEQENRVQSILQTASNLDSSKSSFNHNLKNLANASYWKLKDLSFVTAMIPTCGGFKPQEKKEKEGEQKKESKWLGYEKERKTVTMTVQKLLETSSEWGYSWLHSGVDNSGNVVVFFNKNKLGELDETITIQGTIKERKTYLGVKQTVLNRVKKV